MKSRLPGTLSAAITEITTKISDKKCAELLERSESLIRKWADPDNPSIPNLAQCLVLDRAYFRAGFGEPPIQSWYVNKLGNSIRDDALQAPNIVLFTLHSQSMIGKIASIAAEITEGSVRNQSDMSLNERAEVLSLITQLSDEFEQFENSLLAQIDLLDPVCISSALEN